MWNRIDASDKWTINWTSAKENEMRKMRNAITVHYGTSFNISLTAYSKFANCVQPEGWSKIQFGKNTCNTFHSAVKNYVSRMITVNIHSYTPTEMSVIKLKILHNVMFNLFIWNILKYFYSQSWHMNEVYLHVLMNQPHTIRRTDAIIKISTRLLIMILLHPVL